MKYRVTVDGHTFDVEVGDLDTNPVIATIEGVKFEVWLEQAATDTTPTSTTSTQPLPAMPAPSALPMRSTISPNGSVVYAPIPGVIDSVNVAVGDTVTAGQQLCVLEAMKMKNIIRSTRAGTIAAIHITAGQQVKHHDPLIDYA